MFKTEHDWKMLISSVPKKKFWVCMNCSAVINPTEHQLKSNSFGKPSRKRKINGFYCGERIINEIHES